MKLRIIDNSNSQHLRIELSYIDLDQAQAQTQNQAEAGNPASAQVIKESFETEAFSSPFSNAFLDTLNWYFSEFPNAITNSSASEKKAQDRAKDVITKYIKNGQHLGDALLGENHTLNKFRELIEERGYHQCEVQIESSRIEFFELPWEALILPESNYLLSTTAASFKRVFGKPDAEAKTPEELNFKLSVTGPTQTQLQQMMGGAEAETNSTNEDHTPLNILTLCDANASHSLKNKERSTGKNTASAHDTGFVAHQSVLSELAFDTALNIELGLIDSAASLNSHLQEQAPHILCLTGQIELVDGDAYWQVHDNDQESDPIACSTLFALMQEHRIPLLLLNIDSYQQNGTTVPASTGLAFVSCLAAQAGIHNVIGFNTQVNGFVRQQLLTALYQQITKGLTVAQAVVEARKQLQSDTSQQPLSLLDHAIQIWPVLSHYGNQRLVFFASAPPLIDAQMGVENGQQAQQVFQHLFGFSDDLMPLNPTLVHAIRYDNGEFVQLAKALHAPKVLHERDSSVALIHDSASKQGSGKTLLAQHGAFYAVQKGHCQHAFRFDFTTHDYSEQEMLTMMAPVLGVAGSGEESSGEEAEQSAEQAAIRDKLSHTRCLLVLDNLEPTNSIIRNNNIAQFIEAGQMVLITSSQTPDAWQQANSSLFGDGQPTAIAIQPLTAAQTLGILSAYASQQQSKEGVDDKSSSHNFSTQQKALAMAESSGYNPWLIHKLGAFLPSLLQTEQSNKSEQNSSLPAEWQKQVSESESKHGATKTRFFQWQWQQLPAGLQQLLLICSDFNDVLLEMLMVAWEREQAISESITAEILSSLSSGENANTLLFTDAIPNFNAAIAAWKQQGFVKIRPHGHIIDADAQAFLQGLANNQNNQPSPDLQTQISRLVCAGLRILAEHVLRQQNPAIFRNLLNNRGLWAQQLQKLWSSEHFGEFIKTRTVIEQLMQQAQLGDEFTAWSGKLLQQVALHNLPEPASLAPKQAEHHIAWFTVAVSALEVNSKTSPKSNSTSDDAAISDLLEQATTQSQQWLEQMSKIALSDDPKHPAHLLAMVQHSNNFLTKRYASTKQWQQVQQCNELSLTLLEQAQAWPLVSNILMTLANAHVQQNQADKALACEDRIVFSLPYEHAPPGYRSQKIVDVIINRIQRQEVASLHPLIAELEQGDDANRWQEFLTGVKADVAFAEQRWQDALPYYVKMWQQVTSQMSQQAEQGQQQQALQQLSQQQAMLQERLLTMEKQLPEATFREQFTALAGEDALLPSQLASQLVAESEQ